MNFEAGFYCHWRDNQRGKLGQKEPGNWCRIPINHHKERGKNPEHTKQIISLARFIKKIRNSENNNNNKIN